MIRAICISAAVALLVACTEQKRAPQTTTPPPPKWMRDEPKKIEPSPAVKALAATDDPDLKRQLTPEQIKTTLAAAQPQAEPSYGPALTLTNSGGEWSAMEKKSADQLAAYKQKLEATVVYVGPDGQYHTQGCSALYQDIYNNTLNIMQRRFVGRTETLAGVAASRVARHAACGAPSYDFRYR